MKDTKPWVVVIDGTGQEFKTQEEAKAYYHERFPATKDRMLSFEILYNGQTVDLFKFMEEKID